MKPFLTLAAALTVVLHALACGALQRAAAPAPPPSPTPEVVTGLLGDENGLGPEARAFMKNLLFADEPLEKMLERTSDPDEEPWRSFALAVSHSKKGRVEEAKKELRRVLSMPVAEETRVSLWAWTGLRALGERPPPREADKVRGVVCELHNEAGIGTLAAYADGRARWIGGQGAGNIWEAPGVDKEIDSSVADLLKTVEPLVERSPAVERRMAAEIEREHFRVTILTFGGLHVIDIYGPDVDGKAGYLLPTLMGSVRLLDALQKRQPVKGQ